MDKKYSLKFKLIPDSAPAAVREDPQRRKRWVVNLAYDADTMRDIRKKVRLFKSACMPWSFDFKVTNNRTGEVREL